MASQDDQKAKSSAIELEHAALPTTGEHLGAVLAKVDIKDGDDALNFMADHYADYTPEEEKRVLRKIDFRMMPIMLVVNGLQFVDKLTISFAAVFGLKKQAHLVGTDYSTLVTLFYVGYLIAQYPAVYLMQRYPTGRVITISFLLWGTCLACMAGATNFSELAAARFFLGVFESCVNPGFVLVTSSWWKREEQLTRIGIWYSGNGVFGVPAIMIFYGIALIKDKLYDYQWMFIVFGLLTVAVGLVLWVAMPNSPTDAKFLTERERAIAVKRLQQNQTGIKNTHHKKEQVWECLTDIRVWMLILGIFWHNMTNSLQTTFLGLILEGFGYSPEETILLNLPAGSIAAISILLAGFLGSWKWLEGKRLFLIMLVYLPGIVSCVLLLKIPVKATTKPVLLFAVWFVEITPAAAGIMYSLVANNVAGYTKKTVASAMFFTSYCVANMITPQTFLSNQAPKYTTGIAVTLASFCINICLFGLLYVMYKRENDKRDQMDEGHVTHDETQDIIDAFSDLTDRQNKKLRYKM